MHASLFIFNIFIKKTLMTLKKIYKKNIINLFKFNLNCQQLVNINIATGFTTSEYKKRINFFYSYVYKNIIFINYELTLINIKKIMLFLLNIFVKNKKIFFFNSNILMKSYIYNQNYFIFNEKWENGLITNQQKMNIKFNKMLTEEIEDLIKKNYTYYCKKYKVKKITKEIKSKIKIENKMFNRLPGSFFFCKEDKKDLNVENIITEIHNNKIPSIFCIDTKTELPNTIKNILYILPTNTTSASCAMTYLDIINNIIISSIILKKKKMFNFF